MRLLVLSYIALSVARASVVTAPLSNIQFSSGWHPARADKIPPASESNAPLCVPGAASMYTATDGELFTFSFTGVGVQIISTFDHDHGPFGVSVDGQPAGSGDTFSADPGCSVAWTSQPLNWGNHTIVGTVHPTTDHVFVELLGIVYDATQPSSAPPPEATATSAPPPKATATSNSAATIIVQASASSSPPQSSPTAISSSTPAAISDPAATIAPNTPTHSTDPSPPSTSSSSDGASRNAIPTSSSAPSPAPQARSHRTTMIVVGVCGGVAVAILVGILAWVVRRWRRRRRAAAKAPLLRYAPPLELTREREPAMVSVRLAEEDIDRIAVRMHHLQQLGDDALPAY